jgi:hypothetical protein
MQGDTPQYVEALAVKEGALDPGVFPFQRAQSFDVDRLETREVTTPVVDT